MDATEHLQRIRDKYVDWYRRVLQEQREKTGECTPEVWVQPTVKPGETGPPHPLCVDIMSRKDDKPAMMMVTGDIVTGPLLATFAVGNIPVKLYEAVWEAFPVWLAITDPNWATLDAWQAKWMNPESFPAPDGELSGYVHFLGRPIVEGGGHLFQLDFGSAPIDALQDLLAILAAMGATEIELGRSDGTDLAPDVQAELRVPELTIERLSDLMARLFREMPGVREVQRHSLDQLALVTSDGKESPVVNLDNLHRLLQRTHVEARASELYRFLRGQREVLVPHGVADLSDLRIAIKDDRFINHVKQLGPKMKPLLMQHLVADLWAVCVWDTPNGLRFTTDDEPSQYEITGDQMLARAKQNFLNNRPPVELAEHQSLLVAKTQDCYDATLLLDDNWLCEIAPKVQGDLLACVPARNVVLIGGTADPGTLNDMRQVAKNVEAGGDHLISDTILLRRDSMWVRYEAAHIDLSKPAPLAPPIQARPPAQKRTAQRTPKRPWWKFW